MGKNINRIDIFNSKLNNIKKDNKINYGKLLKRKRLEEQLTLEEVSKGVCSTSYLSRIENELVDVDDGFLTPLFEKLDIKYSDVLKNNDDIFTDCFKLYLKDNITELNSFINDCIESKTHSDIEIKLLVMLSDVIGKSYNEVEVIIDEIDPIMNSLDDEEMFVYCFILCLYHYKTNRYFECYDYGVLLFNSIIGNNVLSEAKYDLLLNIFSISCDDYRFSIIYNEYNRLVYKYSSDKKQLIHYIENTYIEGKYNEYKAEIIFDKIENELIDKKDNYLLNSFKFYKALYYLSINNCFKAYSIYSKDIIDQNNALIFCVILLKQKNFKNWVDSLNKFKIIEFSNSNIISNKVVEYFIKKVERTSDYLLSDFIKNNIILDNNNHYLFKNSIIFKIIYEEYLKVLFEIGKYKEISKMIICCN